MHERQTSEVLGDNQMAHRDAKALRDYQLWVGEVRPRQNEWARQRELIKICKGVRYNRDQVDALEENLRDPARARNHIAYYEEFEGLVIPPAEEVFGEFPVRIVKVGELMGEFDKQSGGIM